MAFAVSSILAGHIDYVPATVFLYGTATLTDISRILRNRHWTSDVFFSAAIGIASGFPDSAIENNP